MIKIKSIALREIRLPLKEPFQISSGVEHERRILLLQLNDADGAEGWSECVAAAMPNYLPETIDTSWLVLCKWIIPRVLGQKFKVPHEITPILEADFRGHNMAKAAVEMGAWDLFAQKQNLPLSKLLGGIREKIGTGISIGIQKNPNSLVKKVQESISEGYQKIKIKIKPGADIEYLAAVREAVGAQAPLMADANNAYTMNDIDRLKQLDQFGLIMIEQPLAWDDVVQHAALQKELTTPICLDESITSLAKARDMVTLGSGKIINIKPGRVAGFSPSIAIHDFCAENDVPVWCGGMLESGIGRAHNVALASLPNFVLPGDVSPSSRYWEKDIVSPEWTMDKEGMVDVPLNQPGIGVTVDHNRIEKLTVRSETIS